jgi:TRAP-type C4-dicarboxylate transport system substrate-binding protein
MAKKRFFTWFFIILLLSVPLFAGGCGQPKTTAPEQEGKGAGKTYQPVELNFATWQPPQYTNNTEVFIPFAEEVAEKTEERVKIYLHPGGVLAKGDETYDAVVTGMIDMGFSLQSYTPGRFPLSTILEFPFMFSSSLQACQAAAELYKTNPVFQQEFLMKLLMRR